MIDGEAFLKSGMMIEKKDVLERGRRIAVEVGLGIKRENIPAGPDGPYLSIYHADDVHRLLGEGAEVFCHNETTNNPNHAKQWHQDPIVDASKGATGMALLLRIRPIKAESEERKLLRELALYKDWQHTKGEPSLYELIDRAKKLLGE